MVIYGQMRLKKEDGEPWRIGDKSRQKKEKRKKAHSHFAIVQSPWTHFFSPFLLTETKSCNSSYNWSLAANLFACTTTAAATSKQETRATKRVTNKHLLSLVWLQSSSPGDQLEAKLLQDSFMCLPACLPVLVWGGKGKKISLSSRSTTPIGSREREKSRLGYKCWV